VAFYRMCQWRRDRGPLGRRNREPVDGTIKQGFSEEKGLWSVANEALLFQPQWVNVIFENHRKSTAFEDGIRE
jgi:hypothetical protein